MDRWAERCVQLAAIGCWVAGSVGHLPLAICDWQDIVNATHQLPRPIDQNSMRLLGQFSLGWSVKSYVKRFHMNMSTCLFAGGAAMPIRTFWQQSFLFSRYFFFFFLKNIPTPFLSEHCRKSEKPVKVLSHECGGLITSNYLIIIFSSKNQGGLLWWNCAVVCEHVSFAFGYLALKF